MRGLIFSLMHQSSLFLSPSLGILLQKASYFPLCSWISSALLLFLLKTLSECEQLNADNPQLSTHLSIHYFIYLLTCLFSPVNPRFPVIALHTFIHFLKHYKNDMTCIFVPPVCFSECPLVLYPPLHTSTLSDNTAICLVIHPSSNTFSFLSPFTQQRLSFHLFLHLSLHQPFHGNISLPFSSLSTLSFLFLPSKSSPYHPELPCLAGVTVADVARPQTSASPCPAASLLCWSH